MADEETRIPNEHRPTFQPYVRKPENLLQYLGRKIREYVGRMGNNLRKTRNYHRAELKALEEFAEKPENEDLRKGNGFLM
jgi:hypothetical protein